MTATITTTSDEGFPAVRLASPSGRLAAVLVPGLNMLCSSLVHDGEDLAFRRAGLAAYAASAKTCGIPLLHPWANRLGADAFEVAGRRVTIAPDAARTGRDANGLANHGLLGGRTPWEIVGQQAGKRSAVLEARFDFSAPELLESFPFPHELRVRAELGDDALAITTTLRPPPGVTVPVSFGWHPYFRLPGSTRESWLVTLPVGRRIELDTRMLPTGGSEDVRIEPAPLGSRTFDDLFTDIAEPRVFALENASRRLEVELDDGYPYVQVWAPEASPFVCFEPMTAATNALADARFAPRCVTGPDAFEATFTVRVLR